MVANEKETRDGIDDGVCSIETELLGWLWLWLIMSTWILCWLSLVFRR